MEVRLLRQALERSATAPQMQLLGTRLTVQNTRVQSAIRDHEEARTRIQEWNGMVADFTKQLESATEEYGRISGDAARQRLLELKIAQAKESLANLSARESQLRAREAELAAAVAEEQNQWLLLNRRLDEIERALPR